MFVLTFIGLLLIFWIFSFHLPLMHFSNALHVPKVTIRFGTASGRFSIEMKGDSGAVSIGCRLSPSLVSRRPNHPRFEPRVYVRELRESSRRQGNIFSMARGWESKSVEQQQQDHSAERQTIHAPISPEHQQRNRKRDGLHLARLHLVQELRATTNARRRQMLEQSIAELDHQLSSFK